MLTEKEKKRVISIREVDEATYREVKAQAALEGLTLRDFVIKVLSEYLERTDKSKGKKKRGGK